MNKIRSLHHVIEHPKINNFLQFESHSSKCVKVRAISDLIASILISVICMIDSWGENTGIIKKTLSKLVFMYSFNVVLGFLDELLDVKE